MPYVPRSYTLGGNYIPAIPVPIAAIPPFPLPHHTFLLLFCICIHLFILHSVRVLYLYKLSRNWRFLLCRALGVFFFLLREQTVCRPWLVQVRCSSFLICFLTCLDFCFGCGSVVSTLLLPLNTLPMNFFLFDVFVYGLDLVVMIGDSFPLIML